MSGLVQVLWRLNFDLGTQVFLLRLYTRVAPQRLRALSITKQRGRLAIQETFRAARKALAIVQAHRMTGGNLGGGHVACVRGPRHIGSEHRCLAPREMILFGHHV
jgi:hypothetical protein